MDGPAVRIFKVKKLGSTSSPIGAGFHNPNLFLQKKINLNPKEVINCILLGYCNGKCVICHLPSICNLQLFLLSHVIPVTCSTHQLTPGQMVLLLFSIRLDPPARGTQMRSWCLVAIGRDEFYSALGPFRFIYLCENPEIHKIFSLHQKTFHQSILRTYYHTVRPPGVECLRYQVTS